MSNARFQGTDTYVATDDLNMAVNAAITLSRPLLVKGEPGTGKAMLAGQTKATLRRIRCRARKIHDHRSG